jgi:polysaccharide chain length determinant protein (PEP-CTERM system associated)
LIPGKQYRPEDFLRIAWRRKWLIVIPFVVITLATVIGTYFLKNTYRSQTLIMIVPQRIPDSYVRSTVTMRIEDRLQSISQQILSRPRLERIINDFNLYAEHRQTAMMEDIVARMRSEIEVQIVKGDAFRVSYVADEPRTAMRVVERLASLFIEENLRDRETLAEGTNQFLEAQLEDARRRLVEREKTVSKYKLEHAEELPSQRNFNLQAQNGAERQVQAIVDSLNIDHERQLNLERQIADLEVSWPVERAVTPRDRDQDPPDDASPTEQLAAARASLQALELRLKPEHPDIVRQKRRIDDLEQRVKLEAKATQPGESVAAERSPAEIARDDRLRELKRELENLTRQIATKEGQEQQLRAAIATYQSRIQAAPTRETELAELTRDYDTLAQIYRGLLEKNEGAKISADLERRQIGEQFKVLEPAHLPETPHSPDRTRLNQMGAALGLALGLALAALLEYFDTSMRSEGDVLVGLALPVLALVPHIAGEDDRRSRRRRHQFWGMGAAAAAIVLTAGAAWLMKA